MLVEISSDTRTAADIPAVTAAVEGGLSLYRDRLTRAEVHLSDVNGPREAPGIRCVLEARPAGMPPVAVTSEAATPDDAVNVAVEKLDRLLTSTFGKQNHVKGNISASGLPT